MNLVYQWLRGDGARGGLAVSEAGDCHGRPKEIANYGECEFVFSDHYSTPMCSSFLLSK